MRFFLASAMRVFLFLNFNQTIENIIVICLSIKMTKIITYADKILDK